MPPWDWSSQRKETRETVVTVQPTMEPSRAGRVIVLLALIGVLLAILVSGLKPDSGAQKSSGRESVDPAELPRVPDLVGADEVPGVTNAETSAGGSPETKVLPVPQREQSQRGPVASTADQPRRPIRTDVADQAGQSDADADETISLEEFRALKGNY